MGFKEEVNWLGRRLCFPFVLCSYLGRSTRDLDVCRGENGGGEEMTEEERKKTGNN
ncbi:hypothetical protein B7P43_G15660 [Cryptotermes secundus]|uniref:Uncharacterized protein n=1 Tax=Cryptotermes secundus TaxID=105785 RepID=A0A2J7RQU4_9NEOP|nr:hypothetical protein B7P43_G15660 [Cryptotermes secundus]